MLSKPLLTVLPLMPGRRLVLASGSRYRRELLARLGLPFESLAPDADESAEPGEGPAALATRLAAKKAHAVAGPDTLVIGSDQVPALGSDILRKPGGRERAIAQLVACQGRTVQFFTAVCLLDTESGRQWSHLDTTEVVFAELSRTDIERYVDAEQPFDSAGSFKAEGLGIALFTAIRSSDPTALIGLPLIAVSGMLRAAGMDPLAGPREAPPGPTEGLRAEP